MQLHNTHLIGLAIDRRGNAASGFTLVELIVVMTIVGIIALVAMPRFVTTQDFYDRGMADDTLSVLRYAQKIAIAQRVSVYAQMTASGITLCYSSTSPCPGGSGVMSPSGARPFVVTPRSGTTFTPGVASFAFDSLGRPSPNTAVTIQVGTPAKTITVERETGYVHD